MKQELDKYGIVEDSDGAKDGESSSISTIDDNILEEWQIGEDSSSNELPQSPFQYSVLPKVVPEATLRSYRLSAKELAFALWGFMVSCAYCVKNDEWRGRSPADYIAKVSSFLHPLPN